MLFEPFAIHHCYQLPRRIEVLLSLYCELLLNLCVFNLIGCSQYRLGPNQRLRVLHLISFTIFQWDSCSYPRILPEPIVLQNICSTFIRSFVLCTTKLKRSKESSTTKSWNSRGSGFFSRCSISNTPLTIAALWYLLQFFIHSF